MSNQLQQLKVLTTVVADTGNFNDIAKYTPQDATTNPSLLLKAVKSDEYRDILLHCCQKAGDQGLSDQDAIAWVSDQLTVEFAGRILAMIPGRVSLEVPARFSFDTQATLLAAEKLMQAVKERGIDPERILIKIAATWEGIEAARILESKGIHCNLTLIFSLVQAVACATSGVTLVSPFVGRIYDWFMKRDGQCDAGAQDPGVQSVTDIYNYYRHFGFSTIVMGASFRKVEQIQSLAGCDYLTISPQLLETLQQSDEPLPQQLNAENAKSLSIDAIDVHEANFRWLLNQDPMATEKLAECIRLFDQDAQALAVLISEGLKQAEHAS